ncbi:DASH complex, subunit Spc19 [Stipitochalara longipes BDJ]|nr:DASH complex, subunit Spc19 [Stipitochalara longipes BDJ]
MTTSQSLASLSASVTSLRSSLSLLDSSISILDSGISDFPRLKTVLSSTRHFELTPSSTLASAQASLASELAPAITTLLQRSEQYIAKLERKQNNLVARSELLEGRLEGGEGKGGGVRRQRSLERLVRRAGTPNSLGREQEERALRLKSLKQKKERLGYAVERLTLQSQQRQRQLRMSVAAT